MKARRGRWLLLVDIAVPRDIEPQVGGLENVYLYDLDALQQVVSHGQAERLREAESARRIVEDELLRLGRRAVSYTHLDVYKRQKCASAAVPPPRW